MSPSAHHRTTLSGYIFATMARIDNRKNLLSSNISFTCSHNMVNFGPLAAEIGWLVGWLEFNIPFQHEYGCIRDEGWDWSGSLGYPCKK